MPSDADAVDNAAAAAEADDADDVDDDDLTQQHDLWAKWLS